MSERNRLKKLRKRLKKEENKIPNDIKMKTVEESNEILKNNYEIEVNKFKNFKIGATYVRGSYGKIYRVSDDGKEFNCKSFVIAKVVIGSDFDELPERKQYVENELKISKLLIGHGCGVLVNILKVDISRARIYMEYAGIPLMTFRKIFPIDPQIIHIFIHNLIVASKFLFNKGLVHRDISERNINVKFDWNDNKPKLLFILCDLGSCSSNPNGTKGIKRSYNGDSLITWKSDIKDVGRVAFSLMNWTISSYTDPTKIENTLRVKFGGLYNVCKNMINDDPNLRPDHDQILRDLSFGDCDIDMGKFFTTNVDSISNNEYELNEL